MEEKYDFYMHGGLNVETYEIFAAQGGFPCAEDAEFYVDHAKIMGSPVLELGCGTGRIAWRLANEGFQVVGLDISKPMLEQAESKRSQNSDAANKLINFVEGDMIDFNLNQEFQLIIIPFRAWQVILSPDDQRRSLFAIKKHLSDKGLLIIDIFDPRLDMCAPGEQDRSKFGNTGRNPVTGLNVAVVITSHFNDVLNQILTEKWRFTEKDDAGMVTRELEETLKMRWTYRWEMRYLFEICGYRIEAEYSDFKKAAPDYGKEQIWLAKKTV